jgi:CRP-like cAMP-binding protein
MTAPPSRSARPLTKKLAQLVRLAPDEIAILEDLQSATRRVRRNREVLTQGQKYDVLFVLIDGAAIRYRILHDGRRQVLNIAVPGDFIGFPSTFLRKCCTR